MTKSETQIVCVVSGGIVVYTQWNTMIGDRTDWDRDYEWRWSKQCKMFARSIVLQRMETRRVGARPPHFLWRP